ncbi:uncharacterized protein LOC129590370 [Paramacrobiotus metropolitanus]|uniref:uncharacterized protein LOC129590370 n=1 Tax=Paramacrobiotus metropolitanus TaxID=2943436 RepID=UPI0024464F58|nr:uncharacterized protein LOC129590370 [Paramacrobiotus metropolitanus]
MLLDNEYDLLATSKEPNLRPPVPLPLSRRPLPPVPNTPEKEQERLIKLHQQQLSDVKNFLFNWQPLICTIIPVVRWTHTWHPLLILSFNVAAFMTFRFLRMSAISLGCLMGMGVALGELLIPIVYRSMLGPFKTRDERKNSEFDAFCAALVDAKAKLGLICASLKRTREAFPQFFATGICVLLLFAAILFNSLGDFVSLFIGSTMTLLLPGFLLNNYHVKMQRFFQCFWRSSAVSAQVKPAAQ